MSPLLSRSYHDVVSALAYSVAARQADSDWYALQPPFNDLTAFILRQRARMPDYLRGPMLAATLGFDLSGLVRSGHRFHTQPPAFRSRQVDSWKNSPVGFARDLVRYYESLATLALYSRETAPVASNPVVKPSSHLGKVLSEPGCDLRCEVAVIGSGPGGAITACLLAEAGRDVLLIEEGPFLALDSCPPFSRREMEQKYRNGGQTVAMGRTKVAYVEGRCVGGGSEINSGLYHRTPPEVLDVWRREFQVADLAEADLRPRF